MTKNIYVGNLPFQITADDLIQAFGEHGAVTKAQVVTDRETGRSRGFGFVEMSSGGETAIAALSGSQFQGRTLTVNEAKPREDRPRSGGSRSGGSYGIGDARRDRY
jgi:RNA recognition motif-containing protein